MKVQNLEACRCGKLESCRCVFAGGNLVSVVLSHRVKFASNYIIQENMMNQFVGIIGVLLTLFLLLQVEVNANDCGIFTTPQSCGNVMDCFWNVATGRCILL